MRNKKDDEHFASDFEYKADQGHDIDKLHKMEKINIKNKKRNYQKGTKTIRNRY